MWDYMEAKFSAREKEYKERLVTLNSRLELCRAELRRKDLDRYFRDELKEQIGALKGAIEGCSRNIAQFKIDRLFRNKGLL